MKSASARPRRKPTRYKLSVTVHPEVRKRLKMLATKEDCSMQEKLHAILCRELGLGNLEIDTPVAASA